MTLRTLTYLSKLEDFQDFRFFDDTEHWHDRAFERVEVYMENFTDLKNEPVDDLFIMSLTFESVIKTKFLNHICGKTITKLSEMYAK